MTNDRTELYIFQEISVTDRRSVKHVLEPQICIGRTGRFVQIDELVKVLVESLTFFWFLVDLLTIILGRV